MRFRLFSMASTYYEEDEVEANSFSAALFGLALAVRDGQIEADDEIVCMDSKARKTVQEVIFEDTSGVFDDECFGDAGTGTPFDMQTEGGCLDKS